MSYNWINKFEKTNDVKQILNNILQFKHINKTTIKDYINFNVPVHDPFLLNNMKEAIEKTKKAKKILGVADYDADGTTSGAILFIGLKELSKFYDFDIDIHIPLRKEGYGLSTHIVDIAKAKDYDLIITVDNGIAAFEAIKYAQDLGIEVIVTDHHQPQRDFSTGEMILPNCLIVDPQIDNYPFKSICGACVAFKFIEALFNNTINPDTGKYFNFKQDYEDLYNELLSMNAIATVADVMQIQDENRYYVGEGLKQLEHCKNPGLKTLIKELSLPALTVDSISYTIGPTINAAGRMATPDIALNLLLAEDLNDCKKLAKQLISLNSQRRKLQRETIDNIPPKIFEDDFIVVYEPKVEKGILGTMASAIAEKYKKPCFVLSGHETLSGSGRSALGYSILSFIQSAKDFISGGGHEAACGISLKQENLSLLRERCNKHFRDWINNNEKKVDINLDIINELDFDQVDFNRLANAISMLEPFGYGNRAPLFSAKNVNVNESYIIGTTTEVLRLELGNNIQAIGFGDVVKNYNEEMKTIDIVFSIGLNEFPKGNVKLQLTIVDFKKSEEK